MVGQGKKIWLINPAAMPPEFEARIQTLKRAQYLRLNGFDVTIISGSFVHNSSINLISDHKPYIIQEYEGGHKFIHIRTIAYKSNGIKRIYHLIEFHIKLWYFARRFEKPDYICQAATVPFGNIGYYVSRKLNAKYIVDVVDLWPESFVAYGLLSKNNLLVKLAYKAEHWFYSKADLLIFSMEGGKEYIQEKRWSIEQGGKVNLNKVFYINNGVDLEDFDYCKNNYTFNDPDLNNNGVFKVIYIGSIRLANNLMKLIEAAALLKDIPDLKFLIFGDGEDRPSLENYCIDNDISNVIFKQKWVELKYVPFILSKSSLNILNYKPSPIFRFGGSQSKSFQYMASGKPICANISMNYCPIKKYDIGIAEEFSSAKAYSEAIKSFYTMDKNRYNQLCINARKAAEQYDYKSLTSSFIRLLNNI
ncbi:MAG: hypothetical protein A2X19_06805 [Bacteroidetes bacterium GWE2_39_28]|nr:MAG: hypothetical protein A2X19_06805 [Bacteroidetes bacterium GWE2_39_28]OFY13073.1 MAG: hypothetical protein A2X16_00485 [Bacteroidetes bacterium GWF2_39_10]OFZ09139.1 MAG: hypothetical protein A2322_06310 [Bacteroidetes bacterium RIFOXYB2_FULL_39_7]OFZ12133.1 MAG: hypothetical protein A2465_08895 [Bacteroidetes bacterium RIFOXYC2_FULL_39_11]HCT94560.1 glycosyltransferase WbuB [Rikenellaceae bacterium]